VDAAIVDGTAVLTTMIHGMLDAGAWTDRRGRHLLDTGAPFYDVYRCADGQFVAVGALEEQFYAALLVGLGVAGDETLPDRNDPRQWPALRERFTDLFASRTRDEWWSVFSGTDACVAPVWSLLEATRDEQNRERGVFVDVDGTVQPDVAPRFSVTPGTVGPVPAPGQHDAEIRAELAL
jgi:alpha-methylacyl-CoA racemase